MKRRPETARGCKFAQRIDDATKTKLAVTGKERMMGCIERGTWVDLEVFKQRYNRGDGVD